VEPETNVYPPSEAALSCLKPPAPAPPIDIDEVDIEHDAEDIALAATASTAVAARHRVEATLLALARRIRKPGAYVGYSAFILMGLLHKCQPCVWEGNTAIDLLATFAPWAKEHCTTEVPVTAVSCALVAKSGGAVECVPISEQHPLHETCHFVAGVQIPGTAVAGDGDVAGGFEVFYAELGVAVRATVVDGDCGLDVMDMMLGRPPSRASRNELRVEISDYLLERIQLPWMHDIMVACQELGAKAAAELASECTLSLALPVDPPSAVAEPAKEPTDQTAERTVDEETFAALRWASGLDQDANVLSLIRALPNEIVEEQVRNYRERSSTAVAAVPAHPDKLRLGICANSVRLGTRLLVGARFHRYCHSHGIYPDKIKKLP
jgi:hypothetical protein